MDAYQQVKYKLEELGIKFDVVEHPPAFTTEQADSYIEGLDMRIRAKRRNRHISTSSMTLRIYEENERAQTIDAKNRSFLRAAFYFANTDYVLYPIFSLKDRMSSSRLSSGRSGKWPLSSSERTLIALIRI